MSVNIHGKEYVTVAERVAQAHKDSKKLSITTEILPNGGKVVVKATVTTEKGTFTGISAANPDKSIEKMSPYEVAETSAVGRALGFAGFGVVEGIATGDEVKKADPTDEWDQTIKEEEPVLPEVRTCDLHKVEMTLKTGTYGRFYSHKTQQGWCNGRPK